MVISVLVEINIDKIFDYNVPENLRDSICLGKRVLVPFGKQTLEGFIINIKKESDYELKDILEVIDSDVILNKELLELGKEISKNNVCNLTSVYLSLGSTIYSYFSVLFPIGGSICPTDISRRMLSHVFPFLLNRFTPLP